MQTIYILVQCDIGHEENIICKLAKIPEVKEVRGTYGIYDIFSRSKQRTSRNWMASRHQRLEKYHT
tara:strand:- start:61 stop:258 length:198 start_codon:yes stop_codon:yes gene_type:complete